MLRSIFRKGMQLLNLHWNLPRPTLALCLKCNIRGSNSWEGKSGYFTQEHSYAQRLVIRNERQLIITWFQTQLVIGNGLEPPNS